MQSDWSQSDNTKVDYIKNKPNLASVATSGDYDDLTNKPTIPPAQVQSNWNESDTSSKSYIQNKPSLAAVATSGNYSDLNGTPTIPTVDQTYDATSTNAQSGAAVAQAVSGKEDEFDAGEGLEFTTDGQGNRVLQVEGPVDIVAGPGIVIDNPDGNTLRVSQAYPTDETDLISTSKELSNGATFQLSESIANFEKVKIFCARNPSANAVECNELYVGANYYFIKSSFIDNGTLIIDNAMLSISGTTVTVNAILRKLLASTTISTATNAPMTATKIVGVHRIANN